MKDLGQLGPFFLLTPGGLATRDPQHRLCYVIDTVWLTKLTKVGVWDGPSQPSIHVLFQTAFLRQILYKGDC